MKIFIYDIDFEYDYDEDESLFDETYYEVSFLNTPTEMVVDDSDLGEWYDDEDLEELLSEYISAETGFLHNGFCWKFLEESK